MGFEIVEQPELNALESRALGVSVTSFRPIYISIDQAKENLINLLLTRKGERLIHTNFGSDLMRIIFEPNVAQLKEIISEVITEPVTYWLPYIIINNIDIVTPEDDPAIVHQIKITITFSLNEIQTQNITFTVDEGGELSVE